MIGPLSSFGVVAVVIFAGVADALPPSKIVGGTPAAPGEFPYMVSLRYLSTHFCGGAIVSPRYIVTAAHCFEDVEPNMYSDIYVITGSTFSNSGTRHAFRKVTPHPNYNPKSRQLAHDIAVIELAADIEFNKNQASIDLPTALVYQGVSANVTGWGKLDAQSENGSLELMKMNVVTLHPPACNWYFRGIFNVLSSQICTYGGAGVGVCSYDSGGPLAYNGQLVGVVSYGLRCALGVPDVYTSVYHHLAWIKKTMQE